MPKPAKKPTSDLSRLQGPWHIITVEVDGAPAPPGGSIIIDGSRFQTEGMGPGYDGDFNVDEGKDPKQFDVTFTAGPHKGKKSLGIYELHDDEWKICIGFAGYSRPAAFATHPGSWSALEILTRGEADAKLESESAPAHATDDAESQLISGEWAMVSVIRDGVPLEPQYVKAGRRVASNGMMTVTVMGQTMLKARFRVDPSQLPKAIDYIMGGPKPVEQAGIYKIEGDTLTTCIALPGAKRPKEFSSDPGSGRTLSVWKLIKR